MSPTSSSLGRSLLLLRHRCDQQVHSMDGHDSSSDPVHLFDRHVSSFLLSLLPPSGDQIPDSFLSLSWINNLLRSFPPLLDEFHSLLLSSKLPNCPSLDRSIADFYDRSVKVLDLLNAVRDGLDRVRHVGSHLGAAVYAINSGQTLRARKLLADLSSLLAADAHPAAPSHRNRSFNRDQPRHRQLRTLSWSVSVSRTWSASRQLQAMGSSLAPPRAADVSATNGFAVPIFTMSSALLFVLWVLVAAVPCQDRGSLHAHVPSPPPPPPPRGYAWAAVMASVQEKVLDEAKRRERKGHSGGVGLMREMWRIENAATKLTEMLGKERSEGREQVVRELEETREGMKEGLESAERQVRELFCRIVRYRTQGLDCSQTRT